MRTMRKFLTVAAINITSAFIFTAPAYAYLDPGTVSYFLQTLIALLVGLSVTIKLYWSSIVSIFKKKENGGNPSGESFGAGDGSAETERGTGSGAETSRDNKPENGKKAESASSGDGGSENGKAR